MKQAVIYKKADLRVVEREIPKLNKGGALIKVSFCGLCATDVSILDGKFPRDFPYFPGHECSGTVEEIGEGITTLKKGDRVVCIPMANPCGKCLFCREGKDQFCVNRTKQELGGFAEYLVAEEKKIYQLPLEIPLRKATLVEPLSIAIHAIDLSEIRPGQSILIIGGGSMGLLALQVALAAGVAVSILSEVIPQRRVFAKEMGANIVVDPLNENLARVAQEATNGMGVDACIEAVGSPVTCSQTIDLTKRGGIIVFLGAVPPEDKIALGPFDVFSKELTIKGCGINFHTYQRSIDLLNRLELEDLLTHQFPLEEIEKAIECFRKREGVKILLQC